MRRALVALALVPALLPAAAGAHHGQKYFSVSGTIRIGHPVARATGGVTELAAQCDPSSPLQGIDAFWIRLPESTLGRAARLDAGEPNDADAWFYDASCRPLPYNGMAHDGPESGVVPTGSVWAVIYLAFGVEGTFTFTVFNGSTEIYPAVASDGSGFLAAWVVIAGTGPDDAERLFAGRLDSSGAPLDGRGVRIADSVWWGPAVAFGGGVYLVVWTGAERTIRAARIAPSGEVLDEIVLHESESVFPASQPRVAFDGSVFLVVWNEEGYDAENSRLDRIAGVRVHPSGTVLDAPPITISAPDQNVEYSEYNSDPDVGALAGVFLVTWAKSSPSDYGLMGARVTSDGDILEPDGFPIAMKESDPRPSVASDGTTFFVTWTSGFYAKVAATRISRDGTILDPGGVVVADHGALSHTAWDGSEYVVTWLRPGSSDPTYDVFASRIADDGSISDEFPVTQADNYQFGAEIASNGSVLLAVWSDFRSGHDWDVYGARVSGDDVLDPDGIPIADF